MNRRDLFKLLGASALAPAISPVKPTPSIDPGEAYVAWRDGLMEKEMRRVMIDEVWQWDASLVEVAIRDHPCIKSIRNKRHRARTLKKYEKTGVRAYLAPRVVWNRF